jgi:molecular chaperone GrpE
MTRDNQKKNEETALDPEQQGTSEAGGDLDGMDAKEPNEDWADAGSEDAVEEIGTDEDVDLEDGDGEGPDEVQEELARLRDQHLRLAADFENFRKRANAELTSVWTRARADLVRGLVEGLDDLQRVSQFTSEDTTVEALIEGVDLVERNLLKALIEAGLEVLDPVGERFDPNCMEAMMRVEVGEEGEDETVHQVFQKGYMFKDQLVRPARVSVYKDDE